ncbi:hypothetical protein [Megasphaera sueciensis]|uniref:hypothetical protein n=1 Tax=Megasphaera sueciensis TaxID=349094 RepID=UPI003D0231F3
MNKAEDTIGTPWLFVNDNYDNLHDEVIENAAARTRAEMGKPTTWKDALQVIGYLAFYAGLGCLLAYGFCNVP